MDEQQCGTCRFWKPERSTDYYAACRRLPPVVPGDKSWKWPCTGRDDWCGEWTGYDDSEQTERPFTET